MKAGSLPWLLRHEVRVRWREALGDTKPSTAVLVGVGVFLVVHLVLWQLVSPLAGALTSPLPPGAAIVAGLLALALAPFALTVGINHSVMALFERGDLDLLVSSPVPTRTVFASRVLGVAVGVFVTLAPFVVPIATLGLLLGVPQLLGALPLLAAIALAGGSLGMLVTLALVRALGPRRARTFAQVVVALAGALLFLLLQAPNVLAQRGSEDVGARLQRWASHFEPGGLLAADSAIWFPARTLLLDPLPTAVTLAGSAAVAWGTVMLLHGAFARGIAVVEGKGRRRRGRAAAPRFARRGGALRVLLAKEWKLILRDPYLISQALLQTLYLLPAFWLLFFSDRGALADVPSGPALATLLVVVGGTLSIALARICVAGEEAPDLLVASPVPARLLRRAKLLASVVPVWALCLPLLVGLALLDPQAAAAGALTGAASTASAAMVRLWNPVKTSRKDVFNQRRVRGDFVLSILEGFAPLVWGLACFLAAVGSPWSVLAVLLGLGLLATGFQRARTKGFAFEPAR